MKKCCIVLCFITLTSPGLSAQHQVRLRPDTDGGKMEFFGSADTVEAEVSFDGNLQILSKKAPGGDLILEAADQIRLINGGQLTLNPAREMYLISKESGIQFYTGNIFRGLIDQSGNFGFGTFDPYHLVSLGRGLADTKLALYDNGTDSSYGMGVQAGQFRFNISTSSARYSFYNGSNPADNPQEIFTIKGNGNVGIQAVSPNYQLSLGNTLSAVKFALYETSATNNFGMGVTAGQFRLNLNGTGARYSFYDRSSAGALEIFTVKGNGTVGINNTNPDEALHVNGNIKVNTSVVHSSDRRYKREINSLKGSLEKLLQLKGVSYTFRKEKFPDLGFDDKLHLGLIAQDLERIFPELVKTYADGYKGVNYTELLPIIIESVKEQQEIIANKTSRLEALEAKNAQLEERLARLESLLDQGEAEAQPSVGVLLYPAQPNPVADQATIRYFIPEGVLQASLLVTDMTGKLVKQIRITSKGSGQTVLPGNLLTAGIYNYSLLVDGQLIGTKQLVAIKN